MLYTTEMDILNTILKDEAARHEAFPVTAKEIYMAHAGVCPLPKAAADAMRRYAELGQCGNQESPWAMDRMADARRNAAQLIGAQPDEIALIGPTSAGLSFVAQGLPWEPGDEVVYYPDDYPANVYPWTMLASKGVRPVALKPAAPGCIAWESVEAALSPRTKLVALASCHYLTGRRIDIDGIGRRLGERGILFSLDAIQTLGAFPTSVEHVDFLSADSHKWMLGPLAAGIFYVKKSRHELLKPVLVGAWNIHSPEFIAQETPRFYVGARRYEPGAMNLIGIAGMNGALELLIDVGREPLARRILELADALLDGLRRLGYRHCLDDYPPAPEILRSGIVTVAHPDRDMRQVYEALAAAGVVASPREDRAGRKFVRFSPHFYNTMNEVDRVVELLR